MKTITSCPRKTDYQTHQMENEKLTYSSSEEPFDVQQWCENHDMNRCQQQRIYRQYCVENQKLRRIFEVMQAESADYPDDLPISFVDVETEIAKCISGCLPDCLEKNKNISLVQSLLRDYKVVRLVPNGNPTVSLRQIHLILQDNFQGSYLLNLLNLVLAEFGTQSKTIEL